MPFSLSRGIPRVPPFHRYPLPATRYPLPATRYPLPVSRFQSPFPASEIDSRHESKLNRVHIGHALVFDRDARPEEVASDRELGAARIKDTELASPVAAGDVSGLARAGLVAKRDRHAHRHSAELGEVKTDGAPDGSKGPVTGCRPLGSARLDHADDTDPWGDCPRRPDTEGPAVHVLTREQNVLRVGTVAAVRDLLGEAKRIDIVLRVAADIPHRRHLKRRPPPERDDCPERP